MRLTDIMSHMQLHVFPEIGLVIFLLVFLSVIVRVLRGRREESRAMSLLPLTDENEAKEIRDER